MNLLSTRSHVAVLGAALLASACAMSPAPKTLVDTAKADPQLGTFNRLVEEAGLAETLRGAGPYTVFAPSDSAFRAVPPATLEALEKDKPKLKAALLNHVVPGALLSADVKNGPVRTAQGSDLALYRAGTFLTADEALVTTADVRATNGVIQVIDKVLLPR